MENDDCWILHFIILDLVMLLQINLINLQIPETSKFDIIINL